MACKVAGESKKYNKNLVAQPSTAVQLDIHVQILPKSLGRLLQRVRTSRSISILHSTYEHAPRYSFLLNSIFGNSPTTEWQDSVSAMLRNGSKFSDHYVDQEHPYKRRRRISIDGPSNELLSHDTSFVRGAQEGYESTINSHSDDDITEAVGQLSLNEDEEVRYHGRVSGLHLLDGSDRIDRRNEGGIWLVILILSSILMVANHWTY